MRLSYIIVTHNRREPLLKTLQILRQGTPLARASWETWVVDNGSTDGTVDAVRQAFPEVNLILREKNEGVWARSHAFQEARGENLILLDDDSYPVGDAARRSMGYLETHPQCAAVVGRVVLPDGSFEACALPSVMLSGAVCLRKSVVPQVGSFRREFFRKAGEYDFSFRILEAGYSIARFEDIVYRHDKVPTGRSAPLSHRMDLRNNLILVERYLPARLRRVYREDFTQRYTVIARHAGCARAAGRARWEAKAWRLREAAAGRQTLSPHTIEDVFQLESQAEAIAVWAKQNCIRRVAIADFSKNLYATFDGCRRAGLEISSIADNNEAFAGQWYRGVPVLPDEESFNDLDGVVISNINPAQVDRSMARVSDFFPGPILRLWQPTLLLQKRMAA
jgi:GT2 family glycosyltransferase